MTTISDGITFDIPNAGAKWPHADMVTAFTVVSGHTHEGGGDGVQLDASSALIDGSITNAKILDGTITSAKLAASTSVTTIANNTYLKWRNAANSADLSAITANAADLLLITLDIAQISLSNDTYLRSQNNAGSGYVNLIKLNTSDEVQLGTTTATPTLKPITTDTYDLGTTTLEYRRLYTNNISFDGGSNDLDYYEEGSFTPVVAGSTVTGAGTYSTQTGRYERVGRTVHFRFFVRYTAHTGTGGTRVTGLPFTSENALDVACALHTDIQDYDGATYTQLTAQVITNSSTARLLQIRDNGTSAEVAIDTGETYIYMSGSYNV